jgi:hypothetical protein
MESILVVELYLANTPIYKVRVELTRGHSHRFLSLVQTGLISAIRRDLVLLTRYLAESSHA